MKLPGIVVVPIAGLIFSLGMVGYNILSTDTANGSTVTVTSHNEVIQATTHTTDLVSSIAKTSDHKTIKQLTLTPENTVIIAGEISAQHSLLGQELLAKAKNNKVVYLLLNSPGGSVLDGNMIVSAIQASPVPVVTIDLQFCASMCAIIHQYGKQRYMVDRSILMFHEAAGGVQGSFNQIHSRFKLFNGIVNKIDSEIAQRVGMKYEDFRSKLSNELWMDAEDAFTNHFSDGYVNLNLTAFLNSNVSPEERVRFWKMFSTNYLIELTNGDLTH